MIVIGWDGRTSLIVIGWDGGTCWIVIELDWTSLIAMAGMVGIA